jgi:hypothetical protein
MGGVSEGAKNIKEVKNTLVDIFSKPKPKPKKRRRKSSN